MVAFYELYIDYSQYINIQSIIIYISEKKDDLSINGKDNFWNK